MKLRPELAQVWEAYAAAVADHEGWAVGAVYMRESKREQVEWFSPTAQLKGTLEEATRRRIWILEATQMAADFASTWQEASPEVQRRITWTTCARILIDRGTFTEVDVRKEASALFAVAAASSSTLRSRPDSNRRSRP